MLFQAEGEQIYASPFEQSEAFFAGKSPGGLADSGIQKSHNLPLLLYMLGTVTACSEPYSPVLYQPPEMSNLSSFLLRQIPTDSLSPLSCSFS